MGKKGRAIIWLVAMAALAAAAWMMIRAAAGPRQPVYDGKPLGFWLVQLTPAERYDQKQHDEAVVAIQQMGTNAIPFLLRLLQARDSEFKSFLGEFDIPGVHFTRATDLNYRALLGFEALGPRAAGEAPDLIRLLRKDPSDEHAYDMEYVLGFIGPAAKAAVPLLAQNTGSTNATLRAGAIVALGGIRSDPELAVPALAKELWDTNWPSTLNAAWALGRFGPDAEPAVPTLVELIKASTKTPAMAKTFRADRRAWQDALKQIDPEAYARVVTNGVAAEN